MTTYAGLDLLMIAPNAVSQWGTSATRDTLAAANPQGNVVVTTTDAIARGTRTLDWTCETRADLTALTTFLDTRRGELVACWIPTYQTDLVVQSIVPFYGTVVTASVFSALMVSTLSYRYWFARTTRGASYSTSYWDTSTDPLDGTHVWTTSPGAGPTNVTNVGDPLSITTPNGFMWSRLLKCRMTSDSYRVRHLGKASTVSAEFVEVAA